MEDKQRSDVEKEKEKKEKIDTHSLPGTNQAGKGPGA